VVLELDAICAMLEELSTSADITANTCSEAETLLNDMLPFEFLERRSPQDQRCSSTVSVIIHHLH